MSSLLGNFLTAYGRGRREDENRKKDDEQWEKRQRLMADLEVERDTKLAKNKRKDGNTYQDSSGAWVTEILDGNGNVTGTRAATASEQAKVQNDTYVAESNKTQSQLGKKKLDTYDEDFKLDQDAKRANIAQSLQSIQASKASVAQGWEGLKRQGTKSLDPTAKAKDEVKEQVYTLASEIEAIPEDDPGDRAKKDAILNEMRVRLALAKERNQDPRAVLAIIKGKIQSLKPPE